MARWSWDRRHRPTEGDERDVTDKEVMPDEDDDVEKRDPNDPGEVRSTFSTVGRGWSGREEDDDDES